MHHRLDRAGKVARSFRQHLCRRPWRRGADQLDTSLCFAGRSAGGCRGRVYQLWAFRANGPTIRHGPPGSGPLPRRTAPVGEAGDGSPRHFRPDKVRAAHRAADTVTSRLQPADAQVAIDRAEGVGALRIDWPLADPFCGSRRGRGLRLGCAKTAQDRMGGRAV